MEDLIIENAKDKVYEAIRNSNLIHDMLEQQEENSIEKNELMDLLYSDKMFRYQLAQILFKMKIVSKKRIEEYVEKRVTEMITDRRRDFKLMQKMMSV